VIALGAHDDAPQILACAEVGVAGYVLREAGVGELVEVLREIERGELRCTRSRR
jgi:DNA-binding NarL/FixJ family response regulator